MKQKQGQINASNYIGEYMKQKQGQINVLNYMEEYMKLN